MQGMSFITHDFVAPNSKGESKSSAPSVVAANVGGLQVVLHARALRGERSLREAAVLVGLNRDELSRIEKGGTTQIRFETIAKILSGYSCSLEELMEVRKIPQENKKSLYGHVVSYLAEHGAVGSEPAQRTVRSAPEVNMHEDEDRVVFDSSSTFIEISGRRRPPLKESRE